MNKPAISPRLWAPIHTPKRGRPYINWTCVATTRKEAKRLLMEFVRPDRRKQVLERVRFARVTITEGTEP